MRTPKYTDSHRYPFGYKRAAETNVSKTFARIKANQAKNAEEVQAKVKVLARK